MKNIFMILTTLIITFSIYAQDVWEQTNYPDGGGFSVITSLAINSSGNIFAATVQFQFYGPVGKGIFRSTDDGDSWAKVNNGLADSIPVWSLEINSSGNIFAGTRYGIFLSTDNGENWTEINNGFSEKPNAVSLSISLSGYVFVGTNYGLFRSTDNGNSWTDVNNNLIYILIAINSSGHIFAGAEHGVFRSTDNGNSWLETSNGLLDTPYISTLAINSSGDIFAGTEYGVFRSTDNGDSWTAVHKGLTDSVFVTHLAINSSEDIFAATEYGVFRSTDTGDSWLEVNNGLPDYSFISSLAINSNGFIFAGIEYGTDSIAAGFFRSVNSTVAVEEKEINNPLTFSLFQNYPNPFNPSTTIEYSVPSSEFVTLKVFDVLGNEVATLVNEGKPNGINKVEFNGSSLSSGIYFYMLKAGRFSETKKLILMK